MKENQIALRAAYLEQENIQLRMGLQDFKFYKSKLQIERDIVKLQVQVRSRSGPDQVQVKVLVKVLVNVPV